MARIVSGQDELQDPGFAFLAGQQGGREFALQQQRQQLQQVQLMQEFQSALARTQEKREKLYQDELERREMEKAQGIQGQRLEQQASGFLMPEGMQGPPTVQQEQLMTMLQAGDEIKTPEAKKAYFSALEGVLGDMQKEQQTQAAKAAIDRAGAIGFADPEAENLRLMSGEDPQAITQDLAKRDQEDTLQRMSMEKANAAISQAQALIEALPPGSESRLRAEYILTDYAKSPTDQARPGSDQDLLRQVKSALIMEQDEKNAFRRGQIQRAQPKPRKGQEKYTWPETFGNREFPEPFQRGSWMTAAGDAMGLSSADVEQPRTSAMQQHIEGKRAEKEKRYPGSTKASGGVPKQATAEQMKGVMHALIEETRDPVELAKRLKDQGIPLTTQTEALIREALQERRINVQSQAGVER